MYLQRDGYERKINNPFNDTRFKLERIRIVQIYKLIKNLSLFLFVVLRR